MPKGTHPVNRLLRGFPNYEDAKMAQMKKDTRLTFRVNSD